MKKSNSNSLINDGEIKMDLSSTENTLPIASESPSEVELPQNTQEVEEDSNVDIKKNIKSIVDTSDNSASKDAVVIVNKETDTASMTSTSDSEDYSISKL